MQDHSSQVRRGRSSIEALVPGVRRRGSEAIELPATDAERPAQVPRVSAARRGGPGHAPAPSPQEGLLAPGVQEAQGVVGAGLAGAAAHRGWRTPAQSRRGYDVAKRAVDVTVAVVLLLLLAGPMLVIAAAIRLDSPGPAFFRQARLGARRRRVDGDQVWRTELFRIWKFRTMFDGADQSAHVAQIKAFVADTPSDGPGARFKRADDPRITRVGRFLRRTSLDELPQLLNVLQGQMSLIGPRPVPLYEADHYGVEHLGRFQSKPGISGPWQVGGRCDLGFEEMMRMDLAYVGRRSIAYDIGLALRTIPAVVSRRGAS